MWCVGHYASNPSPKDGLVVVVVVVVRLNMMQ